jgi:hypothetical protein
MMRQRCTGRRNPLDRAAFGDFSFYFRPSFLWYGKGLAPEDKASGQHLRE